MSSSLFGSDLRLLVLGDVMLDGYASGEVERISPEAPVPVLRHLAHHEVPGGAANVAMNLAALGAKACLVGLVGDDDEAQRLKGILDQAGVEPHLVTAEGRPTTFKLRILAGKHQMLRIDKEDTSAASQDMENALIATVTRLLPSVQALILSDYRKGCLTDHVLRTIIDLATSAGVTVFVDPKRADFAAYAGAAFITPNRAELKLATGIVCDDKDSCRSAAALAMERSRATILLTRSERGMALFEPSGDEIWLPTDAREVFDVSGAGDTVIATFAFAIASGQPVAQALRIANCAAGVVIAKAGTATTTEGEISESLEREHFRPPSVKGPMAWSDAVKVRNDWKREKLVVGFTNGCFDLLHPGHVALLRESAQNCDKLIVALNSDASVRRLKGATRPIQDEASRAEVMAAIGYVDLVAIFDQDTPFELIDALKPDVLIKGSDYQEHEIVGADIVKANGGTIIRVDLRSGQSTTNLVARSKVPEAGAA